MASHGNEPLIILTGAAGNLGTTTHRVLRGAGKEVRAVDLQRSRSSEGPVIQADLTRTADCDRIMKGGGVLVHLASTPEDLGGTTFDETLLLNRCVFDSACRSGIRKIVFASTIQVVAPQKADFSANVPPTHLPLDRDTPSRPDNWHSLAKFCGEETLAMLHRAKGIDTICLRFPYLLRDGALFGENGFHSRLSEVFSYLTYRDAAEAILKVIEADLPGFRTYLPASRRNGLGLSVPDILREFYPDVPLRRPVPEIDGLIDLSDITRETGWEPRDLALFEPAPPTPWWYRMGRKWRRLTRTIG